MHARRRRPVSLWILAMVISALGCHGHAPQALAQDAADSTRWFTRFTHHGLSASHASELDVGAIFSVVSTDPERTRALRLDLGYPYLEPFFFEGRNEVEFAADPLVFIATAFPLLAVAGLCSSCEPTVRVLMAAVAPTWLPLVRPTGVWQPTRWLGVGAGYDSEYVFLSDDKGVTLRPFAGVQLDLGKYARLEGGVQQSWLWNWTRASSDLGAGWYVRVALATAWVGGGGIGQGGGP